MKKKMNFEVFDTNNSYSRIKSDFCKTSTRVKKEWFSIWIKVYLKLILQYADYQNH